MPSKGVQVYSYIAVPGCQIEYSVPGSNLVKNELRQFSNDHLEIDKSNIKGVFNFKGTFSFRVSENGNQIASESVDINVLTGVLEGGTLKSMENQLSIVTNEVIVTYGYYDSGPGVAGLPKSDQCWVTVTPNYSAWMGQVAPQGSPQATKPFSRFMLPAVHDVGMNNMQSADVVIRSSALVEVLTQINPIFAKIVGMVSHEVAMRIAPNIVRGLAITQKDTISTMLAIGARYFEFRPAYLHKVIRGNTAIPDVLYFSHSAIPGMPYAQFLQDVVTFLVAHPEEIVVVQVRWDGVPGDCARPSDEDMNNCINTAIGESNNAIVAGSLDDMLSHSISELRDQHKRLIWFTPADSFSTYTDEGNATLDGDSILDQFNSLTPDHQAGKPFTNLQCQATATNIPEAVAYSVLAANADSSCLLATKPLCDSKTLPWIMENGGKFIEDHLVVVMNDFLDGATADVAVEWSRKRLE
jgi:hypothetical protein